MSKIIQRAAPSVHAAPTHAAKKLSPSSPNVPIGFTRRELPQPDGIKRRASDSWESGQRPAYRPLPFNGRTAMQDLFPTGSSFHPSTTPHNNPHYDPSMDVFLGTGYTQPGYDHSFDRYLGL